MRSLGSCFHSTLYPRQTFFPLWLSVSSSETGGLWWWGSLPAASSSGLGDPASCPRQGLSLESSPLRDTGGARGGGGGGGGWGGQWGDGDRWATRAEGLGLPEPGQHTCVSNFLSSLLEAGLLSSLPPAPWLRGCNQFGWSTADTLWGRGVWGAVGAENHFRILIPASSSQAYLRQGT